MVVLIAQWFCVNVEQSLSLVLRFVRWALHLQTRWVTFCLSTYIWVYFAISSSLFASSLRRVSFLWKKDSKVEQITPISCVFVINGTYSNPLKWAGAQVYQKSRFSVLSERILCAQNTHWRDFSATPITHFHRNNENFSFDVLAEYRLLKKIKCSDYLPMEQ